MHVNTGAETVVNESPELGDDFELKEINDTSVQPEEMVGDADIDHETHDKGIQLLTNFELVQRSIRQNGVTGLYLTGY